MQSLRVGIQKAHKTNMTNANIYTGVNNISSACYSMPHLAATTAPNIIRNTQSWTLILALTLKTATH